MSQAIHAALANAAPSPARDRTVSQAAGTRRALPCQRLCTPPGVPGKVRVRSRAAPGRPQALPLTAPDSQRAAGALIR
jgi:hypothetical protein